MKVAKFEVQPNATSLGHQYTLRPIVRNGRLLAGNFRHRIAESSQSSNGSIFDGRERPICCRVLTGSFYGKGAKS